jgi:hypothetical protein
MNFYAPKYQPQRDQGWLAPGGSAPPAPTIFKKKEIILKIIALPTLFSIYFIKNNI